VFAGVATVVAGLVPGVGDVVPEPDREAESSGATGFGTVNGGVVVDDAVGGAAGVVAGPLAGGVAGGAVGGVVDESVCGADVVAGAVVGGAVVGASGDGGATALPPPSAGAVGDGSGVGARRDGTGMGTRSGRARRPASLAGARPPSACATIGAIAGARTRPATMATRLRIVSGLGAAGG
jgi:hypothetical protein